MAIGPPCSGGSKVFDDGAFGASPNEGNLTPALTDEPSKFAGPELRGLRLACGSRPADLFVDQEWCVVIGSIYQSVRVGQGMRRFSILALAGRELHLYETVVFLGRAEPRASSGCYPLSGKPNERRSE
jgi:hypothetical protein